MIYVMSDIHGNSKRFDSVLSQIDLKPEDTLYILGDGMSFSAYERGAMLDYVYDNARIGISEDVKEGDKRKVRWEIHF